MDGIALRFFVFGHGGGEGSQVEGNAGRQAAGCPIGFQPRCKAFGRQSHRFRQAGGQEDAYGDGFAMGDVEAGLPGFVFDGVGEGVAEVEAAAFAALLFVAAYDAGLDLRRGRNECL